MHSQKLCFSLCRLPVDRLPYTGYLLSARICRPCNSYFPIRKFVAPASIPYSKK